MKRFLILVTSALLFGSLSIATSAAEPLLAPDSSGKAKAAQKRAEKEARRAEEGVRKTTAAKDDADSMDEESSVSEDEESSVSEDEQSSESADDSADEESADSADDGSFDEEAGKQGRELAREKRGEKGAHGREMAREKREANKARQGEKREMVEAYQDEKRAAREAGEGLEAGDAEAPTDDVQQKKPKKPWWKFWDN